MLSCRSPSVKVVSEHTQPAGARAGATSALAIRQAGPVERRRPSRCIIGLTTRRPSCSCHNDYPELSSSWGRACQARPRHSAAYVRINWLKLWALRDPFDPVPLLPAEGTTVQPANGLFGRRRERDGPSASSSAAPLPYRSYLERMRARSSRRAEPTTVHPDEPRGSGNVVLRESTASAATPSTNTCQGRSIYLPRLHDSGPLLHLKHLHPDDDAREFTMVYHAPRTRDELLKVVCESDIIEVAG
ncbi:hypothetical protein F5Y17DRAFT_474034 [Xylariaceae sp. FL0594]|nr:hypothetical protein F5Y17DRAFT_474034 [Xylariaceae sp. FL0594]